MEPQGTLDRMKQDWNERARKDAGFFIAKTSDSETFDRSAQEDLVHLLTGIESSVTHQARVLDLGCGIGRLIKPLAPRVKELCGVDVSGEMIARARVYLGNAANVALYENTGSDLSDLGSDSFDLAYSYLMFQHIPEPAIVKTYLREVHRVLKPGGVFKFQIDGRGDRRTWRLYRAIRGHSSWRGALWRQAEIVEAARDAGFDVTDIRVDERKRWMMRYAYVWVTCVKNG